MFLLAGVTAFKAPKPGNYSLSMLEMLKFVACVIEEDILQGYHCCGLVFKGRTQIKTYEAV